MTILPSQSIQLQSSSLAALQSLKLGTLSRRRIFRIRQLLLVLPWIGLAWQSVLAQSSEDVVCAFLAASGSFLLFFDSFRPHRLVRYPMSSLVMLGFAVTLQLGPLLFTALEGHTITFNLLVPIRTFGHGVLASTVCVLAHAIYRQARWLAQARKLVQRLLVQLLIFKPLHATEVILMGFIGVFALGLSSWFSSLVQSTVVFKFIQGFQFFSVIPSAFVLNGLWSRKDGSNVAASKISLMLFFLFMLLILLVSAGRNARAPFVVPVACLLIGLALEWLYGLIKIRVSSVLSVILAIVLLLPLASDLATAMVMVRGLRNNIPPAELVYETLSQLQDRDAIQRYRIATSDLELTTDWSETYVSNVFLARFTNAKFPDNSLDNASRLSPSAREEFASFQWWRLLSILPGPVMDMLGLPVAMKDEVTKYSFGDKLYSLASGSVSVLGGFRTGHFFGSGMAAYGYAYLFVLLLGLLLVFPLVDAHTLVGPQAVSSVPTVSIVAITQFIAWFSFSGPESVTVLLSFPLRGFIEPVLLFALARWSLSRLRFT